jgi:sialic acid synthase SpsE
MGTRKMKKVYIIAEAAQGFEGNVEVSKLLVRAAAKAGADAIKFQLVFADDLAEPGYEYYGLFQSLEMSLEEWRAVRTLAQELGIELIFDVFGPQSIDLARALKADGIKIHSTCFFDDAFIKDVLTLDAAIYLSIGGIHAHEVHAALDRHGFRERPGFTLMYGYQAEPTPIESNNLNRIPQLRKEYGV